MNRVPIELAIERMTWLASQTDFSQKFDLSYWGNRLTTHAADEPEDPRCGFGGCFMGWAIHQQWFESFGLVMGFEGEDADRSSVVPRVDETSAEQFRPFANRAPGRKTDGAIDATALLFGITRPTLEYIIYEEHYPMGPDEITVGVVRDRLRQLLELGEGDFLDKVIADEEEFSQQQAADAQ